jgi:hypothetical protein
VTNKEFILEKKERTACVLISNCAFALVNGLVIRDGRRPGSGWMSCGMGGCRIAVRPLPRSGAERDDGMPGATPPACALASVSWRLVTLWYHAFSFRLLPCPARSVWFSRDPSEAWPSFSVWSSGDMLRKSISTDRRNKTQHMRSEIEGEARLCIVIIMCSE